MKLATRIFNRERGTGANEYYLTSPFGKRKDPKTGKITYHNGCDYGTHGKKWEQYALEEGTVESCFKDNNGALCVWLKYPRLGIRCLHGHLAIINVKKGQKVSHSTCIGLTGDTGYSTGVHLHLGVKKIGSSTWIDPESIDYSDKPTPSEYPFDGLIKKGCKLYTINGTQYKNSNKKDRIIQVQGEVNGRYKIYCKDFSPTIVYVNKSDVTKQSKIYPFNATIKKGAKLYNVNGQQYPSSNKVDRVVRVDGEVNGRYQIYSTAYRPNVVYCDKSSIKR